MKLTVRHVIKDTLIQSDSSRPETPTMRASNTDTHLLAELRGRNQDLEKVRLLLGLIDSE